MQIRYQEERLVQQLAPWRRALQITAVLALLVPAGLVLGAQEGIGVALPFGFGIVFAGLTLAIWAMGLLMASSWFRSAEAPNGKRGWLLARAERWFDRLFLVLWFLSPLAFVVIAWRP